MWDQDLVHRAEVAAAELERAWYCWRSTHGFVTDPMPTASSYVGYSLEEPWGQPRVIFGLPAEDAEELAGLLVRPDLAGPARLWLAGQAGNGHHEPLDEPVFRQIADQLPGLVVAGPWTMAASAARAEAEARIRANLRGAATTAGEHAPSAQQPAADERSADVAADSDAGQHPSDRPDVAPDVPARRSRVTRGYQIPKLSRAKRPGAVPGI